DWFGIPFRMHKRFTKNLRSIYFYNNFTFKIKPSAVAPVSMNITCIAVNAATFAAVIGIHAVGHTSIGTFHMIDDGFYLLLYIFCVWIGNFPIIYGFNFFLCLLIF